MIGMVIGILAGGLLILCLISLLIRAVTGFIEAVVPRRMATQLLLLKEYQQGHKMMFCDSCRCILSIKRGG